MPGAGRALIRLLAVLLALPMLLAWDTAAPPAVAASGDDPLYLIIDTSGSMADGVPDAKLTVAQRAAYTIIRDLPEGQVVTLITYPGGQRTIEDCPAGNIRFGPAAIDRSRLAAEVRSMTADGGTPTGPALQYAAELFEDTGAAHGTVVLLSDGEANCGFTDVCEVAQELADSGLSLTINTVGYDISSEGADQLDCIARATGGIAVSIDLDGNLSEALELAATASLDVDVDMPTTLASVTGGWNLGSRNRVRVALAPSGTTASSNVRVSLSFSSASDAPGIIYVPSPTRHVGNLGNGVDSAEVDFYPRPAADIDGDVRWRVTVTSDNAQPIVVTGTTSVDGSRDVTSAGSLLRDARHIAVLGDSYSSGEGATGYDDSPFQRCHRSPHAYARQLFGVGTDGRSPTTGQRVSLIACSGAVTKDLARYQYRYGTGPQLRWLDNLAKSDDPPDLVLMTLGGNDARFAALVGSCVLTWQQVFSVGVGATRSVYRTNPCGIRPGDDEEGGFAPYLVPSTLIADLAKGYRDIDGVLNSAAAKERRGGRTAQIVVLGYPDPFPPDERLRGGCFKGVSAVEAGTMRTFLTRLNAAVQHTVSSARDEGIPIHFVDSIHDVFQGGYTICDETPAIVIDAVIPRSGSAPFDGGSSKQELAHPNQLGQRLVAQSLIEWSRSQDVDWDSPHVSSRRVEVQTMYEATWRRFIDGVSIPPNVLPVLGFEPTDDLRCANLIGLQPCEEVSATVVRMIHLESDPVFLGATYGPSPGEDPFAGLTIPEGIEPGEHTLVITTVAEDGTLEVIREPIRIGREGTRAAVSAMLWGLVLIGLGLIVRARPLARLRRRRSARQAA
ncbi:MAG: VWA domain-containing protein [Actinomycetia bacterium]|nr:VWA domain-containing protein [Actinomycetes bacterium]